MARPRKFDEGVALDLAMVVFWRRGYDGASMTELTKAMGINPPSLYFAFGSKRGLFDAVLERYDARRAKHKDAVLAAATAREAAETMLFGAVEWLVDPLEPLGCLMVQAGLSASAANSDVPQELSRRRSRVTKLMAELFEKGQRTGNLTVDVDPAELALYIEMVFSGLCVHAAAGVSRDQLLGMTRRAMQAWPSE